LIQILSRVSCAHEYRQTPVKLTVKGRLLTVAEFQHLADVPPEVEWFRNIRNPRTKRAMLFTGIKGPEEFRDVNRAHVIAWRDELGDDRRNLGGTTIRHRWPRCRRSFSPIPWTIAAERARPARPEVAS
jgi:hypothetical protein